MEKNSLSGIQNRDLLHADFEQGLQIAFVPSQGDIYLIFSNIEEHVYISENSVQPNIKCLQTNRTARRRLFTSHFERTPTPMHIYIEV